MAIWKCAECGSEVNDRVNPSTWCSECKADFCSAWHTSCFSNYHHKSGCKGSHRTVLNPSWIVNLRQVNPAMLEPEYGTTKPFYTKLSPEQQKLLDERTTPRPDTEGTG